MTDFSELDREVEARVQSLGYEVVQLDWAGNRARPILRLRVERSALDRPVSVDDCARVSRGLEPWLDEDGRLPERYVLEVSSPGVERPLRGKRDYERFQGHQIAVTRQGAQKTGGERLEGELLGLDEKDGDLVRLRLHGGDEIRIPLGAVEAARLVYEWKR